jgi:CelD/BcsL family acetyltransferase involved in cellulose biosynthesis
VAFRLADDPARLDEDLATLVALHESRFEDDSDAFAGERRAVHRDFAHAALANGWLRLWLLEVDGAAVAAWLGFRYAGAEWYYQSGRDPAWEKQSVGFVLLAHTVRAAMDDGVDEYRLLRGGEEYKARFSSYDPGLETLALPLTVAGRAAIAAAGAVRALPPDVRRTLVGITG